jgi:hypothetical protein
MYDDDPTEYFHFEENLPERPHWDDHFNNDREAGEDV